MSHWQLGLGLDLNASFFLKITCFHTNQILWIQSKWAIQKAVIFFYANGLLIIVLNNCFMFISPKSKMLILKKTNPENSIKGIVHPKMKITPWFTHPQAILGEYDFLLSDEYSHVLALHNFIMAVNGGREFEAQKSAFILSKSTPHGSGGLIKAFWSKCLCKKNIHI